MQASGHETPPDALRVWRGFRAPMLTQDRYFQQLNTVFVPAAVALQAPLGLRAGLIAVCAGLPKKPASVPDEVALLGWPSQSHLYEARKTLAMRVHATAREAAYAPVSRAEFPRWFEGALIAEQPVSLLREPADWMRGSVRQLIGARPPAMGSGRFLTAVNVALQTIQTEARVTAAIACAGNDYLAYWALCDAPARDDGIELLRATLDWHHVIGATPLTITRELWRADGGLNLTAGASLNLQFDRA